MSDERLEQMRQESRTRYDRLSSVSGGGIVQTGLTTVSNLADREPPARSLGRVGQAVRSGLSAAGKLAARRTLPGFLVATGAGGLAYLEGKDLDVIEAEQTRRAIDRARHSSRVECQASPAGIEVLPGGALRTRRPLPQAQLLRSPGTRSAADRKRMFPVQGVVAPMKRRDDACCASLNFACGSVSMVKLWNRFRLILIAFQLALTFLICLMFFNFVKPHDVWGGVT